MTHETKPKTELLGKVLSKANKEKATMSEVKAAAKSILSESDYKIWIDTIYDASYGEALMLKIAQSIAKATDSTLAEVRDIINSDNEQNDKFQTIYKYKKALLEKLSSLQKPSEKVSSKADDKKVGA